MSPIVLPRATGWRRCASRPLLAVAFAGVVLIADPPNAAAFWVRSQWSRCSDAATAAEWSRHRCRELEPYHDGFGRIGDGMGAFEAAPLSKGRMRRGDVVVRRLG